MTAHYWKHADGRWLIRVDEVVAPGSEIFVTKRNGSLDPVKVGKFVCNPEVPDGKVWQAYEIEEKPKAFRKSRRKYKFPEPTGTVVIEPATVEPLGPGGMAVLSCTECNGKISASTGEMVYFMAYNIDGTLIGAFCQNCVKFK